MYRKAIPGSFWTSTCIAALSLFTALYVISVHQSGGLPTPSFRFLLAMDTLGVQLCPSLYQAGSGLSPFRFCPCRAHNEGLPQICFLQQARFAARRCAKKPCSQICRNPGAFSFAKSPEIKENTIDNKLLAVRIYSVYTTCNIATL